MCRLGRFDGARNHFRIAGQQTDLSDMQRLEKVEKHLAKCLAARKSCDWNSVIRESDAAVVAGADCASKVREPINRPQITFSSFLCAL
jgi:DnaJ family protein C protein 7